MHCQRLGPWCITDEVRIDDRPARLFPAASPIYLALFRYPGFGVKRARELATDRRGGVAIVTEIGGLQDCRFNRICAAKTPQQSLQ